MKRTSQKTLPEIFGALTARLDLLEFYHETIWYDYPQIPDYSMIDEIGSHIYKYPAKDVLKIVENAISRIMKLKAKGDSLVVGVAVVVEDEINDSRFASEHQTKKAKEQLYKRILYQLMYFERKLSIMRESLLLNLSLSNQKNKKDSVLLIPPDELALDERQCVLLFDYLRKRRVIQPLTNTALAIYISLLTGHSESKMRTTKGFTVINGIKSDKFVAKVKKGETENYNLNAVRKSLQDILNEINIEIKRQQKS